MKERLSGLRDDFKALSLFDRIFDIAVIILMAASYIIQVIRKDDFMMALQIGANVGAAATMFIARLLFKRNSLFGKMSLKTQKYINVIVLIGSFGGQFLYLGKYYENYDTVTHIFTGSLCCIITYYAYEAMTDEPTYKHSSLCTSYVLFASLGISLVWETFEFCCDFLTGSSCQYYQCDEGNTKFPYFNDFPIGAKPGEQAPLYDTFSDVICGLIAAVVTALVIKKILDSRKKKAQ